ncbi:uncharacterized protein Z518_01006 [Rhinocladiella mackenziei CBS 650.93]|uniref:Uncharacterized protein n=1 Tax=Rhinocladiella mackenziei CBS 650.93 TaxID=1442369 RepID=A0A0D2JKB1_9EURO|nr:uncharacterized protein Z518_01006 [Rhinocladiella mackenziei CBS 650.93]KIX09925.1 hypothetical protein Z518_01006 [Rhinocladiella mackenziei CBS 650.93]
MDSVRACTISLSFSKLCPIGTLVSIKRTSINVSNVTYRLHSSARLRPGLCLKRSHMSRYADLRAPTELHSDDVDALKADPAMVQLRERRDRLTNEARKESGTLRKAEAEGTKIDQMYKEVDRALRSAKMTALDSAKKASRQQFFDTISTIEINEQLDLSMLDLNEGDWEPKKVEHHLEERRVVADLFPKTIYGEV